MGWRLGKQPGLKLKIGLISGCDLKETRGDPSACKGSVRILRRSVGLKSHVDRSLRQWLLAKSQPAGPQFDSLSARRNRMAALRRGRLGSSACTDKR
jgi:hypothetical protein